MSGPKGLIIIPKMCVYLRDEDAPAKVEDPDAVKPEGWLDDEEDFTADPNAEKPEDWWAGTRHHPLMWKGHRRR